MIEERIVEKFSALGYLSKGNEWYFPIENVKPLIDACQKQNVSIIGVEFFPKEGEKLMPIDPINAIDCSVLLHKYSRWDDVVDCCSEFVRKILIEEEHRDKTQWCSFTFFEQQEWENEDGTAADAVKAKNE